jgi:hypothetical protein
MLIPFALHGVLTANDPRHGKILKGAQLYWPGAARRPKLGRLPACGTG